MCVKMPIICCSESEVDMANPVLNNKVFDMTFNGCEYEVEKMMSPLGVLNKTAILGILMSLTFAYTWLLVTGGFSDKAMLLLNIGVLGGLIMSLIIVFAPKNKFLMLTTSVYAMFEGLALGSISALFNIVYPGIVAQATLGTLITVFGMYVLYSTKLVQATDRLIKVVMLATFGIAGLYILQFILNIFHISIPGIFSNSPIGIFFSVIVVAVAALNLIIDFEFINRYSGEVPSYYEWYSGFSLMVTIVWLYLEILRLLAKVNSRR